MSRLRLALMQYAIGAPESFDAAAAKIEDLVARAARGGARLIVFPEYAAMELAHCAGPAIAGELQASLRFVIELGPRLDALHGDLAARHGVHILAGSRPVLRDGRPRNASHLYTPQGRIGAQEKIAMTRFEDETWGIAAGGPVRVFDTALGRIGIAICFDVEFPLIVRAMAEAGATLILAPSCTDARSGEARVHIGARARALENQCVVAVSQTVGDAPWSPALDVNRGHAAVYGPPDRFFPEDGVIARGTPDRAETLFADVDFEAVAQVREGGAVLNHRSWAGQPGAAPLPCEVVALK